MKDKGIAAGSQSKCVHERLKSLDLLFCTVLTPRFSVGSLSKPGKDTLT